MECSTRQSLIDTTTLAPDQGRMSGCFNVLNPSNLVNGIEARLGCLSLPGRKPINTPHYVAVTSRGAVPHLAPDMVKDHTAIEGVYVPLEDCERLDLFSTTSSGFRF